MKKNCSGIIVIQDLYINLFNLFLALIYIYTYRPPPFFLPWFFKNLNPLSARGSSLYVYTLKSPENQSLFPEDIKWEHLPEIG